MKQPQDDRLPISPILETTAQQAHIGSPGGPVNRRVLVLSLVAAGIALVATGIAIVLVALIGLITNLAYYRRFSIALVAPGATPHWSPWVIGLPVLGGIIVGLMARYGSKAIRGHGIPEAMEQILLKDSRIPARIMFLKPVSAAISIGTGGPFGAEGPIIATGGALGSVVGQIMHTTASERKTLLAAGAAAGMTATFGSPVSAVLLAVELLLFEFRPRSLVPVALASAVAAAARIAWIGNEPAFKMPDITAVAGSAVIFYVILGGLIGVLSVGVTRAVYWIEDLFEELPLHWMFWPALGGIVVGLVGWFEPRTLGVGYTNIESALSGEPMAGAILLFSLLKFISWSISLGSGTSGGTLAPLFTIGGGAGLAAGIGGAMLAPGLGIDPRVAALVGMAAIFAGASRALLTSVVFAFETTRQPFGLLPLLGGCTASYLIASLLMRNSIMTEKIVRRGVHVPDEYAPDPLSRLRVGEVAIREVVTLRSDEIVADTSRKIGSLRHQGFPVIDPSGKLVGVVTRREIETATGSKLGEILQRAPISVSPEQSLRQAADLMTRESVGRLPVVDRRSGRVVGILTRSDLIAAHSRRLREDHHSERTPPWIRAKG